MSLKFKVLNPRKLDPNIFRAAFMDAAKQMVKDVHDDFDEITSEFRHAVQFDETVSGSGDTIVVSVMTSDLGFKYYDQGNGGPDTIIRPVRSKFLHWIDKEGNDVFRRSVRGYNGREAVKKLTEMWDAKIPVYFELAMEKAIKESGY